MNHDRLVVGVRRPAEKLQLPIELVAPHIRNGVVLDELRLGIGQQIVRDNLRMLDR